MNMPVDHDGNRVRPGEPWPPSSRPIGRRRCWRRSSTVTSTNWRRGCAATSGQSRAPARPGPGRRSNH